MKNILATVLFFSILFSPQVILSQQKCKVLIPAISETYVGKCKKGLANGKGLATGIDTYKGRFLKGYPNGIGTYTWASGDEYIGKWEFGKRNGEGIYHFKYNDKDSIQVGIWKDNIYMGPVPPPPTILQSRNVQNYSFQKYGNQDKLSIEIFMNGTINSTIENLVIASTNGSYQNIGRTIVFNSIIYPATFKITYRTWNKLHSSQFNVVFEFTLTEPGNWMLKLTN
ncbi:MAG: hypothetical protein DRJ10_19540 [Bacteroidetes bacterium]|nr:MAG: hypothetical protein DRJ10_19540 [Bacteroidota bacterium]